MGGTLQAHLQVAAEGVARRDLWPEYVQHIDALEVCFDACVRLSAWTTICSAGRGPSPATRDADAVIEDALSRRSRGRARAKEAPHGLRCPRSGAKACQRAFSSGRLCRCPPRTSWTGGRGPFLTFVDVPGVCIWPRRTHQGGAAPVPILAGGGAGPRGALASRISCSPGSCTPNDVSGYFAAQPDPGPPRLRRGWSHADCVSVGPGQRSSGCFGDLCRRPGVEGRPSSRTPTWRRWPSSRGGRMGDAAQIGTTAVSWSVRFGAIPAPEEPLGHDQRVRALHRLHRAGSRQHGLRPGARASPGPCPS